MPSATTVHSSASVLSAGPNLVAITCIVPREVAADLAWQLDKKTLGPSTFPKRSVSGRYRAFYTLLRDTIREHEGIGAEIDARWPSNENAPWDEKSR